MYQLIVVRPEPPGQYTALAYGMPEVRAVAASEQEAIDKVQQLLKEWLAGSRVISVKVEGPKIENTWAALDVHKDPDDPLQKEYLEELARMKREDLEQTLREYERECSNSSSTPIT